MVFDLSHHTHSLSGVAAKTAVECKCRQQKNKGCVLLTLFTNILIDQQKAGIAVFRLLGFRPFAEVVIAGQQLIGDPAIKSRGLTA